MVQAHRIKTIAIVGCTAVGKSETALKLAREFNAVLIGADSMQIYRGFDIGTGKLTKEQCGSIEHRMIDIVDGDADFSVGEYVELAKRDIADVYENGKLPIIVGGTGLYVYSLFSGFNFADAPKDEYVRKSLKLSSSFFGPRVMHALLGGVDKNSADRISCNDCKRIVRALEIYVLKGAPKSQVTVRNEPYDDLTVVLTLPRDLLYEKINARVKKMFDDGLIDEAKSLYRYRNCCSMQALGYKQIISNPDMSRAELETLVAQKTRNYAKRQMTYFNNMQLNKVFVDVRDYDKVREYVRKFTEQ